MRLVQFQQLNKSLEPFWNRFSEELTLKTKTTQIAPEVLLQKGHYFLKEITTLLTNTPLYKENLLSVQGIHTTGNYYSILNKNLNLEHNTPINHTGSLTNLNEQVENLVKQYPQKLKNLRTDNLNPFQFNYKITARTQQLLYIIHYQEFDSKTKWLYVYDCNFENRHEPQIIEEARSGYRAKKEKFLELYKAYSLEIAKVDEHEMASQLGLSLPYFRQFIKQTTGYTLWQYHLDQRLQKALHDLIFLDKNYEELSFPYGFNNYKAFKRALESHYKTKFKYIKENIRKLI